MSAEIEAATDLKVKYSRRLHKDGRDEEQSEVKMLDDGERHSDLGLQKSEKHNQKNLQAGKRSHFRVFQWSLGVLYLLILAGFILRSTLKINWLEAELSDMRENNSQLQHSYEILSKNQSHLKDDVKMLKDKIKGKWCPDGWTRFGCSCYNKFTESKTWSDSRKHCQERGADLVIVNSKEEQQFVRKLNGNGESWIGLRVSGNEWKWVDGSPLTEQFWETRTAPTSYNYAACYISNGTWKTLYQNDNKNWICEK